MPSGVGGTQRSSLWGADVWTFVGLGLFVLILTVIDSLGDPSLGDGWLIGLGVAMSLVPALFWLTIFYRRDALEPEPKSLVAAVSVTGGLLAVAVAVPTVDGLFAVDEWLYRTTWSHLLGAILVVGFVQETAKYIGLRLFVHDSAEFDDPTDGVVYGTAIGIGFAAVLNLAFVIESGGAELGPAAFRVVITTVAHASFGGLIGLFTAQQKHRERPAWWTALGLAVASTLNGIFFFFRSSWGTGSSHLLGQPTGTWLGLLLAGAVGLVVASLLARQIAREAGLSRSTA